MRARVLRAALSSARMRAMLKNSCHFWLRFRNHFSARKMKQQVGPHSYRNYHVANCDESWVKRGANGAACCAARAAANAARLDRCALRWRGAARSPQACARPHTLWQRPAAAREQGTPALTRGPRSSLAPLGCYCLGAQILPAGSPRRLAFALPVKGALACRR